MHESVGVGQIGFMASIIGTSSQWVAFPRPLLFDGFQNDGPAGGADATLNGFRVAELSTAARTS